MLKEAKVKELEYSSSFHVMDELRISLKRREETCAKYLKNI